MSIEHKLIEKSQIEDIHNLENERFNRFSIIINSIRAISIFLIAIMHMSYWFRNIRAHSNFFVLKIIDFGSVGVDLFFFLSGMLLTINMLNRGVENNSWNEWYKRRIIRIFPAYWIMLSIIIVFSYIKNIYFGLAQILVNFSGFTMIPIYNPNFKLIHFIYWYITVMLLCYLLFPLMFNAIRKNFIATTVIGLILFISFIFYFYSLLLISIYKSKDFLNVESMQVGIGFYLTKFFVFFFGIVFGYWIQNNNMENLDKIYKIKIGIALFIILIVIVILSLFGYIAGIYLFLLLPFITIVSIPLLLFFSINFIKSINF